MDVTCTHIWHFFIWRWKLWVIIHKINTEQNDENLDVGRFISTHMYPRNKIEKVIGNIKVDRNRKLRQQLIIGEVKNLPTLKRLPIINFLFGHANRDGDRSDR
ncbi:MULTISPECIES: Dna2/Cas4 domain-containing protein [Bacillaceae]|jgi:CRISPR-associated exonuclease Cas4|uniref:Dna2/Cas4 domain-containing protein n=1 Tax=Bacillaceae TaxID=186817 RepID=UPI000D54D5AF|nr:hypothetical protein CQJ30_15660 [Caldibacillus thermoamylovorans]MCB5936795.1 CRISPR-associated protein Cas4 [Bacillus sp. DFI.2.34]MCB7078341.1 CRISPR-associated protein Cas4 [Caldibacillus thermoamylovorans]